MITFSKVLHKICLSWIPSLPGEGFPVAQTLYQSAETGMDFLEPIVTFHGEEIILDVGCGLGARAVFYAQAGAKKVIGLEIDPTRALFAKNHARNSHFYENVDIVIADAANLPFPAEIFDRVISTDTWEHLRQPDLGMIESIRVLRSGGKAVIKAMPYFSPWGAHAWLWLPIPWLPSLLPQKALFSLLSRLDILFQINKKLAKEVRIDWQHPDDPAHARGLTVGRMKSILPTHGVRIERFQLVPLGFRAGGWLSSIGNIMARSSILREFFTGLVFVIIQKL